MAALDVARGIALASTALAVGTVLFLARSWRPAGDAEVTGRLLRMLALAALAGLASSLAALALEIRPSALQTSAWAAGAAAWLVLAASAGSAARAPASLERPTAAAAIAVACCAVLVLVPGLSGNAAEQSLAALVVAANAGHVLSAGAWTGGIACLLVVSAWALAQRDRLGPLSQAMHGFSSVALVAVVGIALTGVLQGIALVGRVEALVTTGYGRLVMAKAALLCLLALAGALHRGRTLPDLGAAARSQGSGEAAVLALRRLLIGEALLLTVVFGLTAVLAGGRPPSRSETLVRATAAFDGGELTLRATPGRPGANDLRIELRGPAARPQPARLTVSARQRRLGLGPIELRARRLGDGRFFVSRAPLDAPGTWELRVADEGGTRATLRLRLR